MQQKQQCIKIIKDSMDLSSIQQKLKEGLRRATKTSFYAGFFGVVAALADLLILRQVAFVFWELCTGEPVQISNFYVVQLMFALMARVIAQILRRRTGIIAGNTCEDAYNQALFEVAATNEGQLVWDSLARTQLINAHVLCRGASNYWRRFFPAVLSSVACTVIVAILSSFTSLAQTGVFLLCIAAFVGVSLAVNLAQNYLERHGTTAQTSAQSKAHRWFAGGVQPAGMQPAGMQTVGVQPAGMQPVGNDQSAGTLHFSSAFQTSESTYFSFVFSQIKYLRCFIAGSEYTHLAEERDEKMQSAPLARLTLQTAAPLVLFGAYVLLSGLLLWYFEPLTQIHFVLSLLGIYTLARWLFVAFLMSAARMRAQADQMLQSLITQVSPIKEGMLIPVAGDHLMAQKVDLFAVDAAHKPQLVIHNMNLDIPSVGLTLFVAPRQEDLQALTRFFAAQQSSYTGTFLLGGKLVLDIDPRAKCDYITKVSSYSWVFEASVRDNLVMGNPSAQERELWSVLATLGLADEMGELGGLDVVLMPQTQPYSASFMYRLLLARALLHASPLYVIELLDTLDAYDLSLIMQTLTSVSRYKAVCVLSSTTCVAPVAHKVYVLQDQVLLGGTSFDDLCIAHPELAEQFEHDMGRVSAHE